MSDLFLKDPQIQKLAVSPMYLSVRDLECYRPLKQLLEGIFKENGQFIGDNPTQFRNQLVTRFEDTIWHLCLLGYLSKSGFELQKAPPRGPDIKAVQNGKTIWIEVINSSLGENVQNPTFENDVFVEWGLTNDPRVTTRLTSAICDKSKKIRSYIPEIVHPEDIKIIAVSAHLNDRARRDQKGRSLMDVVLFDKVSVVKPNGNSEVDLGLFNQETHAHIDQIIYVPLDPLVYFDSLGKVIEIYKRSP